MSDEKKELPPRTFLGESLLDEKDEGDTMNPALYTLSRGIKLLFYRLAKDKEGQIPYRICVSSATDPSRGWELQSGSLGSEGGLSAQDVLDALEGEGPMKAKIVPGATKSDLTFVVGGRILGKEQKVELPLVQVQSTTALMFFVATLSAQQLRNKPSRKGKELSLGPAGLAMLLSGQL